MKSSQQAASAPSQAFLPQLVILTGSLSIAVAGLWYLYMSDAPYHPDKEAAAFLSD